MDNGRDALAEVRRLDPDVLVMDISMPILDGSRAAAQLEPESMSNQGGVSDYVSPTLAAGKAGRSLANINQPDISCANHMEKTWEWKRLGHGKDLGLTGLNVWGTVSGRATGICKTHGKERHMSKSFLLFPMLLATAFAQVVAIHPHFAQQGFNPLNPAAVGHPVITGNSVANDVLLTAFTVTNYSTKTVTSVEYAWRIAAPSACSDSTLPVSFDSRVANLKIAPGAEVTIAAPSVLSGAGTAKVLARRATANRAPVVIVTVGILQVIYADGSTWTDKEAIDSENFDNGRAEKEDSCHATKRS